MVRVRVNAHLRDVPTHDNVGAAFAAVAVEVRPTRHHKELRHEARLQHVRRHLLVSAEAADGAHAAA